MKDDELSELLNKCKYNIQETNETFIDNLKDSIKDTINEVFIYPFKSFFTSITNFIKNFWKFRSIIYRDRWWDYEFLINLIVFKLDDMILNWDKAHYIGSEFTKKRMIVIRNRIRDYEEKKDEIYRKYFNDKETLNKKINELDKKTWLTFGKNIQRFWD